MRFTKNVEKVNLPFRWLDGMLLGQDWGHPIKDDQAHLSMRLLAHVGCVLTPKTRF